MGIKMGIIMKKIDKSRGYEQFRTTKKTSYINRDINIMNQTIETTLKSSMLSIQSKMIKKAIR